MIEQDCKNYCYVLWDELLLQERNFINKENDKSIF